MGTIALSRAPMIFIPVAAFLFPQQKITDYLNHTFLNTGDPVALTAADLTGFIISVLVMIFVIIWIVALLFNAYKICVNKKGARLIASFIIAVIISEIISKILIFNFFPNPVINQFLSR